MSCKSIDAMESADWDDVRRIYAEGIASGDATFETELPEREHWDRAHLAECRLVARQHDRVVGWAACRSPRRSSRTSRSRRDRSAEPFLMSGEVSWVTGSRRP